MNPFHLKLALVMVFTIAIGKKMKNKVQAGLRDLDCAYKMTGKKSLEKGCEPHNSLLKIL